MLIGLKLIHCADVHIDSALGAHLPPDKAAARRSELLHTFAAIADYAVQNGVRAVLVAGDLFDAERVTRKAANFVLDTVRACRGVDFYILRGNHDGGMKAFENAEIPANMHFFAPGFTCYELENVRIGGAEDLRDPAVYDEVNFPHETFNIGMFHGAVGTAVGEDRICLPRLCGKSINYLALGHYHTFHTKQFERNGVWVYSGCPEGRGFDECGPKGFVLIDTDECKVSFVSSSRRCLWEFKADITGCTTTREVEAAVLSAAASAAPDDLVRVVLTGHYTVETEKDLPYLTDVLSRRFYFAEVRDESSLAIDPADYKHDVSLRGEFVRLVSASHMPAEEKERVLACGIRALMGEEVQL